MNHKERNISTGYVLLKDKTHSKSFNRTGNGVKTHVYEHHVIAEEILGRELTGDEVVHHLDNNKTNNSPDNLLILMKAQHTKLHGWLNKNIVIPKPKQLIRNARGCIRCGYCDKPISPELKKFCSQKCMYAYNKTIMLKETPIDHLTKLVSELPMTKVGKLLGLSDKGVKKRCDKLGIKIPNKKKYT